MRSEDPKAHVNRKRKPVGTVMRDKEAMRAAAGIIQRSFTKPGSEVSSPKPQERRPDSITYDENSSRGLADGDSKSDFAHLGATVIRGCMVNRAAGQLYPRLSAKLPEPKQKTHTSKAQEQTEMVGGKASDVDQERADEEMEDGEFCKDREDDEEIEDHEREYGNPEERESVPTVGDALAKFAAGEPRSQKWKGSCRRAGGKEDVR